MTIRYTNILIIALIYISGIITQIILLLPLHIILLSIIPLILLLFFKKPFSFIILAAFIIGILNTFIVDNNYFFQKVHSYYNQHTLIQGKVITHPIQTKKYLKFHLKLKKIKNKPIHGRIVVLLKTKITINKSDTLYIYGKIKPPRGPANFGEVDYGLYYKKMQIDGTLFVNNKQQIKKIIPLKKYSLPYLALLIRKDMQNYLKKYYYPIQNSFLNGLLLGERVHIPSVVKNIFIQSGTIHLLAISGLHVGLLTIIFFTIFFNIGFSKRVSFILTLLLLILYNYIIGYKPPTFRSTLMFASILFCYIFDRDRNYLNNLALAGLIILLLNPLAIKSISFQMSFLATAGIIIFTPVLNLSIAKYFPFKNKIFHFFKNIFTASVSCQIFLLPLLFFHFKQFPYISLIANLFAIPLTTIILFLSVSAYLFYHIISPLTFLIAKTSNFLIALLIFILNYLSKTPVLKFSAFNYTLLFLYLFIIYIFFQKRFSLKILPFLKKVKIKYSLIGILIILSFANIFLSEPSLKMTHNNDLEILFFNIKGKSILIKTPADKFILIDAGYESDLQKHILPYFKRNKINKIDYFITSNILSSRSEAVPHLLNNFNINCFFDSGFFSKKYRQERIMEILSLKKINLKIIASGSRFTISKVKFQILNPPSSYFKSFKDNNHDIKNNSLVIKLTYKNKNILLCADIKRRAVKFLIDVHKNKLKSDIINLPDIDKDNYYITDLLEHVNPSYAIINKRFSYFEKGDINFIQEVLKLYKIKYYFTEKKGAVKININKRIKVTTSR